MLHLTYSSSQDVFPTLEDPDPPVHTLDTLRLPMKILDLFGVDSKSRDEHVWEVKVILEETSDGRIQRRVVVHHKGIVVDESLSRAWRP